MKEFLETKGLEYSPFDPKRCFDLYKRMNLEIASKVIHIVGTNGKGSTGRYITLGLLNAGYSVLHFSSPHIFDFAERFYINGKNASYQDLQDAHNFLQGSDFIGEASYFEYATFLAFVLSKDMDFLVLEAGLGGEFDCSNVVKKDASVITKIGFDHMDILGNSIEQIATTKLNAMSQNVFIGIQDHKVVYEIAKRVAKNLGVSNINFLQTYDLHKKPEFLAQNFALAKMVLEYFGVSLDGELELDLMGRAQKICENITIDVGHNVDSASAMVEYFLGKKVVLIYNSYAQKDIFMILKTLKPIISRVEIIDIGDCRVVQKSVLKGILSDLDIDFMDFNKNIDKDSEYLVFGSFGVVRDFMRWFYEK